MMTLPIVPINSFQESKKELPSSEKNGGLFDFLRHFSRSSKKIHHDDRADQRAASAGDSHSQTSANREQPSEITQQSIYDATQMKILVANTAHDLKTVSALDDLQRSILSRFYCN